MTNREIEDVLTSIRRLVAQEGGRGAEVGRLILTAAQRVNAANAAPGDLAPVAEDDAGDTALALDETLDESHVSIPAPDFGKLEATIAELEAAVSASGDYEAEGAQEGPPASNVTELYGRLSFVHRSPEPEAEAGAESAAAAEPEAEPEAIAPARADPGAEVVEYLEPAPHDLDPQEPRAWAGTDTDTDADTTEDETVLDEETLRLLIAEIVRDELRGQLGERVTQMVRKLVRAEIAKALDERNYL